MIVGWHQNTAIGIRIWESRDRGPICSHVDGRREQILRAERLYRSMATIRRQNWRLTNKHRRGHNIAVRIWRTDAPGAA